MYVVVPTLGSVCCVPEIIGTVPMYITTPPAPSATCSCITLVSMRAVVPVKRRSLSKDRPIGSSLGWEHNMCVEKAFASKQATCRHLPGTESATEKYKQKNAKRKHHSILDQVQSTTIFTL